MITALTRAKKGCYIIGNESYLKVSNYRDSVNHSFNIDALSPLSLSLSCSLTKIGKPCFNMPATH